MSFSEEEARARARVTVVPRLLSLPNHNAVVFYQPSFRLIAARSVNNNNFSFKTDLWKQKNANPHSS